MCPSVPLLTRRSLSLLAPGHVQGCTLLRGALRHAVRPHACSSRTTSLIDPKCRHVGWQPQYSSRPYFRSVSTQAGKSDILKGINPQHRDDVARVVEQAERAGSMWTTLFTGERKRGACASYYVHSLINRTCFTRWSFHCGRHADEMTGVLRRFLHTTSGGRRDGRGATAGGSLCISLWGLCAG